MHCEFYKKKKSGEWERFECLKNQSTVVKSRLSLSAMSNYCQGVYVRRWGDGEPINLHRIAIQTEERVESRECGVKTVRRAFYFRTMNLHMDLKRWILQCSYISRKFQFQYDGCKIGLLFLVDSLAHFKIKYMFCVKHLYKSITLGGKIRVAALKLVNTKSFVFPRLKA